jgi:hypothetical protein
VNKTVVFILLFITAGGLLSAQSYRETRIYVPPIDGEGYIDDLAWFYRQVTAEIDSLHRTLGRSRRTSDYVVTGRLMPLAGEKIQTLPGSENDEYVLYVELFDNRLNDTIGNQYITYSYPDERTAASLSVIIYNMLSPLPDLAVQYGEDDNWRNRFVYLNLSFLWTPRVYTGTYQSVNAAGVGAEAMINIHFLRFLALKAGAELSQEWVVVYQDDAYTDMILDFPAAISFVLRPGDYMMLEPYVGGNLNLSLNGKTKPYPFSWMAGVQLGIKAGIGIVTFDPRFSMDLSRSQTVVPTPYEYWRYSIHLGIGYKMGFIQR